MLRVAILFCALGVVLSGPPLTKTREQIQAFRDALERSRRDDGVGFGARMAANPRAQPWENSGRYQGDMLLSDEQLEALVADFAGNNTGPGGRAALILPENRWPGNVVVFEFGDREFNAAQETAILRGMQWVEHFSCVRFRRRRPYERDFVLITGKPNGCYATVGYRPHSYIHTLNLARDEPGRGCLDNIVIIHQLLHNLGFFHMHSAYERYNYVRINWDNIMPGMEHNFYRYGRDMVSLLQLPYEYQSSMHYSPHAFSINRHPTIVATRGFTGEMGHMRYVTHLDWVRLRRLYNCPGAWDERTLRDVQREVNRTLPLLLAAAAPPTQ